MRKHFLYWAWGGLSDRERDRRKWRHHCRAKIGDELTLSLANISYNWRWVYTFPCQKFTLFVSPFTLPVSLFLNGHYCGAKIRIEITLSVAKKFHPLYSDFLKWREPRDEWSKTEDKWSNLAQSYTVLLIKKKKGIKLIPKTLGNRKRDCAWDGSGGGGVW